MADRVSKEARSMIMSRVRSSGNKTTELATATLFRNLRIHGWKRKQRLLGSPDFVFRKHRLLVFVDGCFWHGCPRHFRLPTSNVSFWKNKIETNWARDRKIDAALKAKGWTVVRIWEHSLKLPNRKRLANRLRRLFGPLSK